MESDLGARNWGMGMVFGSGWGLEADGVWKPGPENGMKLQSTMSQCAGPARVTQVLAEGEQ